MRRLSFLALASILGLVWVACGGDQYSHGRTYEPLSEEEELYERAAEANYEEVRRNPQAATEKLIGWFGMVQKVDADAAGGPAKVAMTLRYHQKRHMCEDQFESSCRVTVSEREGGPFTAILRLRPEDQSGKDRVYAGSLLKVYGKPTGDYDDEGGPVINAQYYRHWPRGKYVTPAMRGIMRR